MLGPIHDIICGSTSITSNIVLPILKPHGFRGGPLGQGFNKVPGGYRNSSSKGKADSHLHGLHLDLELDDLVDGAFDLEHDGLLWQTFSKVCTLVYLLYNVTIEGTF